MKTNSNAVINDESAVPLTLAEGLAAKAKTGFGFVRAVFERSGNGVRAIRRGKPKKVLLIESDRISNLILQETMESAGLQVEQATTGGQALQKIAEAGLDAILMDLTIGGMRGTELIAKARQCPAFADRPIYVFTCRGRGWAEAAIPGATRIFNKLSSSARQAVTALVEALSGAGESAGALSAPELEPATLPTFQEVPGLIKETVSSLEASLRMLMEKTAGELGYGRWQALRAEVGFLVSSLAVAGRRDAARLSAALESFLDGLPDDPEEVAEQDWRTAAFALEMISFMGAGPAAEQEAPSELNVAVLAEVTTEARSKVSEVLVNVGCQPTWFAQADQLLGHLQSHLEDLVVLDMAFPEAGYFGKKIHDLSSPTKPAVLVVTSKTETNNLPGPLALTATAELVLKALLLVERSRLSILPVSAPAPADAPAQEHPEPQPDAPAPSDVPAPEAGNQAAGEEVNPAPGAGPATDPPSAEAVAMPAWNPANPDSEAGAGAPAPCVDSQPGVPAEASTQELLARMVENERDLHELRTRLAQQGETSKRLESDLENARTGKAEVEQRLAEQARGVDEAQQSHRELQSQLEAAKAELEGARIGKAELEKRLAEQIRSVVETQQFHRELQSQLEAAKAELENARGGQAELEKRLGEQALSVDETQQIHRDLQGQLEAVKAELESARTGKAELELRQAEQARNLEDGLRLRSELESALAAAKTEAERSARLEQEITSLRQASIAGPEAASAAGALRGPAGALARLTVEVEKERRERQRAEQRAAHLASQLQRLHDDLSEHLELERRHQDRISDLEQQLRAGEQALAINRAELEQESSGRQLAEEQARGRSDSSAQLEKTLALLEEAKLGFRRTRQELETRLQAALSSRSQSEAKLQEESAERRRLAEELQAKEAKWQQQSQENALEIAKLRSDLELEGFERKRLEAAVQRYQQGASESVRAGAAQVSRLRRQVGQHVHKLRQASCGLLQTELPDEPKRVVEALLENVISIEAVLAEPEVAGAGGSTEALTS